MSIDVPIMGAVNREYMEQVFISSINITTKAILYRYYYLSSKGQSIFIGKKSVLLISLNYFIIIIKLKLF